MSVLHALRTFCILLTLHALRALPLVHSFDIEGAPSCITASATATAIATIPLQLQLRLYGYGYGWRHCYHYSNS